MLVFTPNAGGVQLALPLEAIDVLAIVPELLASLGDPADDPAAARLDVAIYPDDGPASAEFRRLMHTEFESGRAADRSAFETTLEAAASGPVTLSDAEADAWLVVLGEARLALAARMGIEDESWERSDGPDADPSEALLHFLTALQSELTEVLLTKL